MPYLRIAWASGFVQMNSWRHPFIPRGATSAWPTDVNAQAGYPRGMGDVQAATRTATRLGALTGALVVAVLVTGCTSGGDHASHATATTTATQTASPAPTVTETVTPSSTPSTSNKTTGAAPLCTVAQLSGAIGEQNGAPAGSGSGMNQQRVAIILTNTGKTPCTLQGWPGVSLVGDGNGTQLGAAATLDRTAAHPTVAIGPGGKAQAPIDYVEPAVYSPSECNQKPADGLRVYPPGSAASLFIPQKWDACTSTQHVLLTVGAFVTYP